MGNIFNKDFRDLIDCFNRWEVKYIMVGGMAVILHGYVRTTGDMDIWVAKTQENHLLICRAFQDFGMSLFDMTEENFISDKFDVWSFGREPVRVDLMTEVKGLKFDEAMAKAQYYDEEGVTIRYLHLTSLIAAKRASGRHKDLDDIEQLS
ncbi:MAG TPA: nucleotidyltransferase [Flavipsychrobacter sp.]|nr:nucleotidyltransferase [Flavipsychrobacter sp.]